MILQFAYKNKELVVKAFPEMVNFKIILLVAQKLNYYFATDPPTAIQDRMIQACSAAFSLSLAYEMNRLQNDLHEIDPTLASDLLRESAECLPSSPELRSYLARVLKNVL